MNETKLAIDKKSPFTMQEIDLILNVAKHRGYKWYGLREAVGIDDWGAVLLARDVEGHDWVPMKDNPGYKTLFDYFAYNFHADEVKFTRDLDLCMGLFREIGFNKYCPLPLTIECTVNSWWVKVFTDHFIPGNAQGVIGPIVHEILSFAICLVFCQYAKTVKTGEVVAGVDWKVTNG